MNAARKRAARIALYIECAGVAPVVSGSPYREHCDYLHEQYRSITPEVRRSARLEGRRLIRQSLGRASGIWGIAANTMQYL